MRPIICPFPASLLLIGWKSICDMWGQSMRSEFIIPKVLPPAILWLKNQPDLLAIHGGRVSDEMSQTLPCLRVTVGFYLPANRWERKPVYQIDAWGKTMGEADTLGTLV